ncbi:MAG: hypothetical protein UW30_C0004G0039 [Candidatus Giovannonibacteria bacterium GW2011_GWA2_44_13b]|uniref:Uncharacterized protein n=1 Tax=Candidatus Giovannonibacteria bacterium GW2011_GWA2_44_13b TaxID=1618647 RepID=A0A0G1H4Y8_9BACT|nr:MAG: hypothetical protein UW30_C0004G0039 [Candidatus Giovannonibacteria bacterium GW2011_GWA2_44_13b]
MKLEKRIIIGLLAGILAVIGAFYFVFGRNARPVVSPGTKTPPQISLNTQETGFDNGDSGFSKQPASNAPTVFVEPADEPKISLKNSIFEEKIDSMGDFSSGSDTFIYQTKKIIQKSLETAIFPQKTLTNEEVFKILYPQFVIDFFSAIQEELILQEAVTTQRFDFNSEEDIKDFSIMVGKYLLAKGTIDSANYKEFEKNILYVFNMPFEGKRLEAMELSKKFDTASWNSFSPPTTKEAKEEFLAATGIVEILGAQTVYSMPAFQELVPSAPTSLNCTAPSLAGNEPPAVMWSPILETVKFLDLFYPLINKANAFCGATYCIIPASGYCWMEGAPLPGGSNILGVPCCSGRVCGVPIGCLELCGSGSKPFIWMPGICGCG